MHHDPQFVALEIDPVIPQAQAVERFAGAFQFTKALQFRTHDFLRQATKFAQDVELQFLGHFSQLGRAGGVENDLERSHGVEPRNTRNTQKDAPEFRDSARVWVTFPDDSIFSCV